MYVSISLSTYTYVCVYIYIHMCNYKPAQRKLPFAGYLRLTIPQQEWEFGVHRFDRYVGRHNSNCWLSGT